MLASGAGGTGLLTVSKGAYVKVGGLTINTGGGRSSMVSLEMDSNAHSLIHTTAVSTLGGTMDVQVLGIYRPREGDKFAVIASTDPSGVYFVGNFSAVHQQHHPGAAGGFLAPSAAPPSGSDYELVFLGYTDGDANGDHWVDGGDLALMGAGWKQSGQSWATGDFTGDGCGGRRRLVAVGQQLELAPAVAASRRRCPSPSQRRWSCPDSGAAGLVAKRRLWPACAATMDLPAGPAVALGERRVSLLS